MRVVVVVVVVPNPNPSFAHCRLYQSAGGAPEGGAPGGFPEGGEAPPSGGGSGSGPKIEEVD